MKVNLDDSGKLKLSKKDIAEIGENMAEELFKSNKLLDEGIEFIPDEVKEYMATLEPRKMELAEKRFEARLKKREKREKEDIKVMTQRNKAVHTPLPEYEQVMAEAVAENREFTEEEKHMRFIKEGLMSAVFTLLDSWKKDLERIEDVYRVQERHFGDRDAKIEKGEKLTDEERYGTLKYEVQKDGTNMPIMKDLPLADLTQMKSTEFYTLYMSEILERLIRENIDTYKNDFNRTGVTDAYEEEAIKISEELSKLQ